MLLILGVIVIPSRYITQYAINNNAIPRNTYLIVFINRSVRGLIIFRFPINGIAGSKTSAANPLKRQIEEHCNLRPYRSVPINTTRLIATKKDIDESIPLVPHELIVLIYSDELVSSKCSGVVVHGRGIA